MPKRNSHVNGVAIKSMLFGSVFEVGDTVHLNPKTYALAVQRTRELFFADEGNFYLFRAFNKPIPIPPIPSLPTINKVNEIPGIRVGHINVKVISSSGLLHIGSTHHILSEARVLHIRQLTPGQRHAGKIEAKER